MAHINADLYYDREEIMTVVDTLKTVQKALEETGDANARHVRKAIDVLRDVADEMECDDPDEEEMDDD